MFFPRHTDKLDKNIYVDFLEGRRQTDPLWRFHPPIAVDDEEAAAGGSHTQSTTTGTRTQTLSPARQTALWEVGFFSARHV